MPGTPSSDLDALVNKLTAADASFRETLTDLHRSYSEVADGEVADYIPELAKADPNWFGVSVVTADGRGNSVRGIRVCQELSRRFGLHVFESGFTGERLEAQLEPSRRS